MAKIKIKNNSSGGAVPSGLSAGELAVNLTDRKLYIGTSDISGSIFPFLPGVSAIAAGSGISLANGKTQGDVTIINAGVTSIFGLTGIVGLTGTDGITLSVSGRTLTIQGPGAGSGSGFTYYNGITTFAFGYQLKGSQLTSSDTCKFYLSSSGLNYFLNLTKVGANNNNTDKTTTNLQGLLENSAYSPTLHCVNERTKRVIVFQPLTTSTPFTIASGTQQLSLVRKTFTGQSENDFVAGSGGESGDWITIHFTMTPVPGGFAFTSGGGLCAESVTPTILTDTDGITHISASQQFLIDPTNIVDIDGASAIDEANDGFIFYDINATGTKLRKTTFKKAVLDSSDTLFATRTSNQILKGKDTTAVYFDTINAATISGSDNGLLTGATAFKYLEANTVKSLNGNTGHVAINIVNTYNGRTGDVQGVSAAVGGTAISVSGNTGEVTITNTGVWSINGATGDITNIAKTDTAQTFTGLQTFTTGISAAGACLSGDLYLNAIKTPVKNASSLSLASVNETSVVPGVLYTGGELNAIASNKISFSVGSGSNTVPYPFIEFTNSNTNSNADINFTALGGDINMSAGGGIIINPVTYVNLADNVLYVDDANDRVGINTSTPSVSLDVSGTMKVSGGVTFTSNIYAPNIVTSINGATGDITGLSASTVVLGTTNTNNTRYLVFAATAGDQSLLIDNVTTPLSYNPFSGTVGAKVFEATSINHTVKLDAAVNHIYVSNSTSGNVNTVSEYGIEYSSGVNDAYFYSLSRPISLVAPAIKMSNDDAAIYGGSPTWGYTFPAANGTSGQAMFTTGNGQLYWSNAVSTFNGSTGAVVGVSTFNGSTGAVVGVSSVNGLTGAVKVGRSISIYAPTTTDNITMFYTSNALTLSNIESVLRGAGTGVTFSVRYGTDRSATGTEVVTSGIKCTNTTTGLSTTSFNNGTISASSFVWLTIAGVSGNPNELSVTLEF